jgi:hypothetical protein
MPPGDEAFSAEMAALESHIAAQLEAWQRLVLEGFTLPQVEAEQAAWECQEIAPRIPAFLTIHLHCLHPWYSRAEVFEEILSRPWCARRTPLLGAGDAICRAIAAQLLQWQRQLLQDSGPEDLVHRPEIARRRQDLAEDLAVWLVQPLTGYDPWLDDAGALTLAVAYQVRGPESVRRAYIPGAGEDEGG